MKVALGFVLITLLAGCGSGHDRAVSAEVVMPHAAPTFTTTIPLPGTPRGAYIGAIAIAKAPGLTCAGNGLGLSYTTRRASVAIAVDDGAVQRCGGATPIQAIVGGFGSGGGYVGEWLPVAVTYR